MTTIRRLAHSCVIVTDDEHATLIDPDFFTFTSGVIDLSTIGDITRVLITHEHGDHVHPEFVAWLKDRRDDLTVFSNQAVQTMLSKSDISVSTEVPEGTSVQDVFHERIPNGATPPNRAWTVDNVFTHPGDSYGLNACAPVLSLSLCNGVGRLRQATRSPPGDPRARLLSVGAGPQLHPEPGRGTAA